MTAEAVIALPILMLAVMACMQICLLFFAKSTALAAAQQGVRAARAYGASHTSGAGVAKQYAERTASGFLTSISAASTGDANTIRVTVTGRSLSLVPFLPAIGISEQAAGAVERFSPAEGTP
ncbi:TadE family protein [Nonomuraea sp. NPDC050227]|uniref:TadE family protein n=1 Tax=Nonomuraea sp. NPDC050227 TaxID=3364360 RepID=UPI0037A3E58F